MSDNIKDSIQQSTLKHEVHFDGIGLHSGKKVNMTLSPAPVDTGIVFRRKDIIPVAQIKLCVDGMKEAVMCSKLVRGDLSIATIEHLMSALCAFCVDNVYIDLDAPEVPVFDGSARVFVQALESIAILPQTKPRSYLRILKPISVKQDDNDQWVKLLPNEQGDNNLYFNVKIDFEHPAIASTPNEVEFTLTKRGFVTQVAHARTFGFAKDLDKLHSNKLALGASLDNAIGLSEDGILNKTGLRYQDEFVRHKLLDAIGDIYVAGPIIGRYEAFKPSHALNHRCLKALLDSKGNESFEVVTLDSSD
jgi:UDP-3-O-[3-hydroxymyristoyl] N-acetylglucosamine deacetylase